MIIIGRFGGKYALVHFRGAYLEVDLYDMRPTNRLLEVLGCDVELRKRIRWSEMGDSFYAKLCFPYRRIGKQKAKDDG